MAALPLLRPVVLEYLVSGRLDGVTQAPPFVQPPPRPMAPQEVEDLGLIDLTGEGSQGATAGRFVKWILIVGPNNPVNDNNVAIAFDGERQRVEAGIPPLANGLYSRNCIFVPQLAQLQLDGMVAGPDPILVRIALWRPDSIPALAEIQNSCCCKAGCFDMFGNPCFAQAIYSPAAGARTLSGVVPGVVARGATVALTVSGTGFQPSDQFAIVLDGVPIRINSTLFVNSTTFTVNVTAATDQLQGDYDLFITPQLGGKLYRAVLPSSITVP